MVPDRPPKKFVMIGKAAKYFLVAIEAQVHDHLPPPNVYREKPDLRDVQIIEQVDMLAAITRGHGIAPCRIRSDGRGRKRSDLSIPDTSTSTYMDSDVDASTLRKCWLTISQSDGIYFSPRRQRIPFGRRAPHIPFIAPIVLGQDATERLRAPALMRG